MRFALLLCAPAVLIAPLLALVVLGSDEQLTRIACPPAGGTEQAGVSGVTGGVTKPVTGRVTVAQANVPTRSGDAGFRTVMGRLMTSHPDLVTLNEQSARPSADIESVLPGYTAFRDTSSPAGQASQALDTVVAWKSDEWTQESAGRIQIVTEDHTVYHGRPVVWDRFATWALLKRNSDGAIVAVVSVHHMTNPAQFGPNKPARQAQYGQGMDNLTRLLASLSAHGPVFVGGDFNVSAAAKHGQGRAAWAAPMKMAAAGYASYVDGVDYVFYPRTPTIKLTRRWKGPTVEPDHRWIAAQFTLHGATASTASSGGRVEQAVAKGAAATPAAATGSAGSLPKVPGFTAEQVQNAAQVVAAGKALKVPNKGLAIGLMTALGESGLRNIGYGDAAGPDSRGLFQQRGNGQWGSLTDRMNPYVAATSFFTAMLKVPGWSSMTPTLAAHATQRNADANYYTAYWDKGVTLLGALAGSAAVASITGPAATTGCATPVAYASGQVGWPVPAQYVDSDAHNYGHTGSHWANFHTGTDFSVPLGTPVLAATSGVVHLKSGGGWSWAGIWLVQVQTAGPGSLTTWYAHMQQLSVKDGDYVTVGQQLGLSGAEGNVTGPHLHFEVHPKGGTYMQDQVDPSPWLEKNVGKPVAGVATPAAAASGGTS